ncbi:MAG TPA: hypothetical protein VFJ02_07445 [Vicinamibacterales bacterium]|nr:hypothetical protein [Vicinamibacterales bacterium]
MGRVIPFVACVLVTSVARATVLVPAEFKEIVSGSQIIAYARIVDVRPEWADGRRWIDSVVTADVVSYLKGGSDQETISFKVPGGQLGRYRSVVVGAPTFKRGDEAVLFLKRQGDDLPNVFGLNQGVFRVRVDRRTGERMVVPPPAMKADESSSDAQRLTRGALDRRPLAFAAFGARVREVMAATPKVAR